MLEAITATYASSGARSGVATSPMCRLLAGSLSRDASPSNMSGVGALDERRPVVVGDRQVGDLVAAGAGLDRLEDVLHRRDVTDR